MIRIDEYGLVGYPLSHSLSATWFTAWFEKTGRSARYTLFPLQEGIDFRAWVSEQPALKGFNVTIPFKQNILKALDQITPVAKQIGAVNAVKVERNNLDIELIGTNTDWLGFSKALLELGIPDNAKALILGTGGAAAAAAYALDELNVSYFFVSRNPRHENQLNYREITPDILAERKLVINAAPWGMFPDLNSYPPLPYTSASDEHLFFDMVYNPRLTKFMQLAQQAGARTSNGYRMLVLQALLSWEWWQEDLNE